MTIPDLLRQLADETEKRMAAEAEALRLQTELAEARAAAVATEPHAWLTEKEASTLFGISTSRLQKDRMLNPPMIPFRKSGKSIHYFRGDLEEFNRQNVKGRKKAA